MTFLRKLDLILFLLFIFNTFLLFLMINLIYKGNQMIQFLIDFGIFSIAVLLAVGIIFLLGSILFSFFNKNKYDISNDL